MNWADEQYTSGGGFDKDSVDILDVLVKAGARIGNANARHGWWDDEVSVFCPFCEDFASRRPAGRANTTKQLYHCWACGFGGDVITIARKYLATPDDLDGKAPMSVATEWLTLEVAGSAR